MLHPRKTKKTALIQEFSDKITSGNIPTGSVFPTTDELARRYKISPGTAAKVITELGKAGLLDISRGRRTKVSMSLPRQNYPQLDKPVGVLNPNMNFFQHARWRAWTLHHIQSTLLSHGNTSIWLPDPDEAFRQIESYSGFIVTGELISEEWWKKLLAAGKPCVRLSFQRPYLNTQYVDVRPVLDRIAIHIAETQCRRLIIVNATAQETEASRGWFEEVGFLSLNQHYGIAPADCIFVSMDQEHGASEALKQAISTTQKKIAVVSSASIFTMPITETMEFFGRRIGSEYELIALCHVPAEITVGDYVDLKCELMVERLLQIFYRQYQTPTPQFSQPLYPELILNSKA